ncbi:MAG: cytochrome c, partial [Calditrichaceae bacterium]
GFLNPGYIPSLVFRTFIACMIAGLFGYVTCVFMEESDLRTKLIKYCSKWLMYPVPALILSGIWYYYSIPAAVRETNFSLNPQSMIFLNMFIVLTIVLFLGGIFIALKSSTIIQRILAFVLVIIGLAWMGGFEYSREIARKPYVIHGYMYSTSILKADMNKINTSGLLKSARWNRIKEITGDNRTEAGRELFNLQCLSCHTVNGIRNDVVKKSAGNTYLGILSLLNGQGKVHNYMPPFAGTDLEKQVLAEYITKNLLKKKIISETPGYKITPMKEEIPAFNVKKDEYILLVWNDLGMHCISDNDSLFVILPPANTLEAQLIKRRYSDKTFGKKLDDNFGLFGNGINGQFRFDDERMSYIAEGIPVVPYSDDGSYLPYPLFTVKAVDEATGNVLIETKAVTPVSTEMGCLNCHEGGWRFNNIAGIDMETSTNILAVHDRINGTNLLDQARNGNPKLCQSCHADPALGAEGDSTILNFSAAMHGWHANYVPYNDARACVLCHPAANRGNTRCSRGFHNLVDITCVDCHGTFQEHGLALLKGEESKPAAQRLMANLNPSQVGSNDDIHTRLPWLKEPDCLTCHEDFENPA